MSRIMDDMRQEVMHEEAVRIAKRILETGKFTYEEIAECTELSVEEIEGLDYKVGEQNTPQLYKKDSTNDKK